MKIAVLILVCLCIATTCYGENFATREDKIFSMIFDLHSEKMGYDRTEQICGFGTTMKEKGYAIYKGKKYYPDKQGFIIINTENK